MDGLADRVLDWLQQYTGIDMGGPSPSPSPSPGPAAAPTPTPGPASAPPPPPQPNGADRTVPRPLPPGTKVVHGKVPGPKNHLLTEPDGFVADVDAKLIIANSLDEYKIAFPHPTHGGGGHGGGAHPEAPPDPNAPLGPGDDVLVGGNRYIIFDDEIRTGGTVSWRGRNPGNIRIGDRYGAYPGKKLHTKSVGTFAIFPTEEAGMAAITQVLKGYGKITVKQAMNKYAPSSDHNDPDAYARMVAKAMGASVDDPLDTLSDGQMHKFAEEIKRVEGWKPGVALKWDDPKVPEEIRNRLGKGKSP